MTTDPPETEREPAETPAERSTTQGMAIPTWVIDCPYCSNPTQSVISTDFGEAISMLRLHGIEYGHPPIRVILPR